MNTPVAMLIWCPECGERHIDEGEFATKPHHTHACQECGHCWRPAVVATCGVQFLPGFKNAANAPLWPHCHNEQQPDIKNCGCVSNSWHEIGCLNSREPSPGALPVCQSCGSTDTRTGGGCNDYTFHTRRWDD